MTENQHIQVVKKTFCSVFPDAGTPRVFFAPGRVNLIGEHIDYNGGHVFPCALTLGTYAAAAARSDRKLRFYSENFKEDGVVECSLDDLKNDPAHGWANYAKAVVWSYAQHGYTLPAGFDVVCTGNLPAKSGLSSSASVEVVTGTLMAALFGLPVEQKENALLCQYAENRFIGVNCGIMDQFSSAKGKKDHALFLNTATLDCQTVPLDLSGRRLIIVNTNVKHELASSAYNDRRGACEEALADIRKVRPIGALCELSPQDFDAVKGAIRREEALKRARHAVTEEARTVQAVDCLQRGDLAAFGRLMNGSHESLKNDFEVSCAELDVLAETAQTLPGVLGARMTGGGFGGCTVNIVEEDSVPAFIETLGRIYTEKTGLTASFYTAAAGDGAHECI